MLFNILGYVYILLIDYGMCYNILNGISLVKDDTQRRFMMKRLRWSIAVYFLLFSRKLNAKPAIASSRSSMPGKQ